MPTPVSASAASVAAALRRAEPIALACEPCAEGVLAGVGIGYLAHARDGQLRLAASTSLQPRLGERVVDVPPTLDEGTVGFARRVLEGFLAKTGRGHGASRPRAGKAGGSLAFVRRLALVTASDDPSMPEVVHRYMRLGFSLGPRTSRLMTDPRVAAFDDLARRVSTECERTRQFVRFSRMADGSFAAIYLPGANTIPLTARHFAERMGTERFCLFDPLHRVAALHETGRRTCELVRLDAQLARQFSLSEGFAEDEPYVRAMWQSFFLNTTTPGRGREQRGYDLQLRWIPKRLRTGMIELWDQAEPRDLEVPLRYRGSQLPSDDRGQRDLPAG